ncbi:LysR substrate-binding domain-containing protein [Paenalcaligenes sp. Me131]|uniref:LysR substrate-binding domain-containing protein n=1 Tax=Paenalcaligenes sp. Me131 TaxID=3392636 RepID=UPI003D2C6175
MNNLRRIDLNLLLCLHALLEEKHVSRAASRLHKSQPAMSHALAHLRRIFNDPLLVRREGKLTLTSKATDLLPLLHQSLNQLETLFQAPTFDPTHEARSFRLAMSDYGARLILPKLVRTLRQQAPHIELLISQGSREAMLAQVMDAEVDIALGVFPTGVTPALKQQILFNEAFTCVADASTLNHTGTLALDEWLARPHVSVAMQPHLNNEIDVALQAMGAKRHVMVSLPHWGVANTLIAGTDLILTIATRNLSPEGLHAPLCSFAPPLDIALFEFVQVWHTRRDADPAHHWLRQQIAQIAQQQS